jgi:hypothetical protein
MATLDLVAQDVGLCIINHHVVTVLSHEAK